MSEEGLIDEVTPEVPQAIEPAPEPAPEVTPEPPKPEVPRWALGRINEETNKRIAAERRAQEAEAILQRLQTRTPDQPPPSPAPVNQQQYAADVQAEAARVRLYEDSLAVRSAGFEAFPNFGETLATLQHLGVTEDDFVFDLIATDRANAHVILDKLAKDPERAMSLARMDPRRRVAELTRMTMTESKSAAPAKPAAPLVSRAPAPKPAMEALSTPTTDDFHDELSDAEFSARWDRKYLKRA